MSKDDNIEILNQMRREAASLEMLCGHVNTNGMPEMQELIIKLRRMIGREIGELTNG